MVGQGAAASQPPFNILVDIKVAVATPSAACLPGGLEAAVVVVVVPLLGRLQALAAHRFYRSQGKQPRIVWWGIFKCFL